MTENNPLELKSILTTDKSFAKNYFATLKRTFTYDWVFSKWYEKLIVFVTFAYSCFSLGKFLINLI